MKLEFHKLIMKLADKFLSGKHKGRSLKTVLNCDLSYIKYLHKNGHLSLNTFTIKTYNL